MMFDSSTRSLARFQSLENLRGGHHHRLSTWLLLQTVQRHRIRSLLRRSVTVIRVMKAEKLRECDAGNCPKIPRSTPPHPHVFTARTAQEMSR